MKFLPGVAEEMLIVAII